MAKTASTWQSEKRETEIQRVSGANVRAAADALAVEEPLEIRLGVTEENRKTHRAVSITMRTPGDDFALAAGFLFTEGILQTPNQIENIKHCGKFPNNRNTVRIDLTAETVIDFKKLERNFYTTSSCGVCGKSSLEALETGAKSIAHSPEFFQISAKIVHSLPEKLRNAQKVFDQTGGLHAAALFDRTGNLLSLREDIGRHNAVDKLIGAKFLSGNLPLDNTILLLSGRAGFELVQKALMAQIPFVGAVGAPSSLAVEAAEKFNLTLLGFVRDDRFNIYTGAERISEIAPGRG